MEPKIHSFTMLLLQRWLISCDKNSHQNDRGPINAQLHTIEAELVINLFSCVYLFKVLGLTNAHSCSHWSVVLQSKVYGPLHLADVVEVLKV